MNLVGGALWMTNALRVMRKAPFILVATSIATKCAMVASVIDTKLVQYVNKLK